MSGIAARRLRAQHLTGELFASPVDAIRHLGAVQAQDYHGGKWGLGQRIRRSTDAGLDRQFDDGTILRTHVLRPTWHFVVPADIRWMLELTGSKILRGLTARHRELELDDRVVTRAEMAITSALRDARCLTRPELGDVLRAARIAPDGQRLPHLLAHAELDALIVSGPRRGKQFTYALLEERAPKARTLDRVEALAELTRRYFRSHGPAQLQDFAWWSGLGTTAARNGISLAGPALAHETIEGNDYWFDGEAGSPGKTGGVAHLLPNFDEYTVAYRDRTAVYPDHSFEPAFSSFGSVLSNVVTIGGLVRGAWRRRPWRSGVQVEITLLARAKPAEVEAVEAAGRLMGRFLERPVRLIGP